MSIKSISNWIATSSTLSIAELLKDGSSTTLDILRGTVEGPLNFIFIPWTDLGEAVSGKIDEMQFILKFWSEVSAAETYKTV